MSNDLWSMTRLNRFKERSQLFLVQPTVSPESTTHVNSKGLHFPNRFGDVSCLQSACQKKWDVDLFPYLPTQTPVVRAACPTEFLYRQRLIAGIEQHGIYKRTNSQRFINRFRTTDMHNLNQRNAG